MGYWIQLQVGGGEPTRVLLDTGSKGLMLREDFLDKQHLQHTGRKFRQVFLDGTVFEGEVVKTSVRIGPVVTREPIFVLSISKIECSKQKSDCPGKIFTNKSVAGIMGVGLGDVTSLDNPLEHLSRGQDNGFIISGGNAARSACLTVGLTPTNREGFTAYRMPKRSLTFSWREAFMKSNAIPGCFSVNGTGINNECGRILFDTGSSVNLLHLKKQETEIEGSAVAGMVLSGQVVSVTPEGMPEIVLANDGTLWSGLFKIGHDSDGVTILGAGAFKYLDVLYDISDNVIGLRQAR